MITELSLYQEVHLAQQGGLTPFGSDDQTQAGPQEEGASCWGGIGWRLLYKSAILLFFTGGLFTELLQQTDIWYTLIQLQGRDV